MARGREFIPHWKTVEEREAMTGREAQAYIREYQRLGAELRAKIPVDPVRIFHGMQKPPMTPFTITKADSDE